MPSATQEQDKTLPLFSHIYVESELLEPPWLSTVEKFRDRFTRATLVELEHYSQLTQRRSASWLDQKRSPKLILARKHGELVYPCSDVAPNFGHPNFFYAVPMQNCLYDCEYCYLQGMYTSAHMVYFVNQNEIIQRVQELARELGELYLCIAYDNDILALESLFGVARTWMEGLREESGVTVEIRTKSANFSALSDLVAPPNFILAWTLSPQPVVDRFEQKTPPLKARLKSMQQALEKGWRVRLCLDPLLPVKDWSRVYGELFQALDEAHIWEGLEDSCFGLFRMPKPYLRQARKARPESALLQEARSKEERGLYTLGGPEQHQLLEQVKSALEKRMERSRVWQT